MFDDTTMVMGFLEDFENHFARNENAKITTFLANHISMRNKEKGNTREYLLEIEIAHLATVSKDKRNKKRRNNQDVAVQASQKKQ